MERGSPKTVTASSKETAAASSGLYEMVPPGAAQSLPFELLIARAGGLTNDSELDYTTTKAADTVVLWFSEGDSVGAPYPVGVHRTICELATGGPFREPLAICESRYSSTLGVAYTFSRLPLLLPPGVWLVAGSAGFQAGDSCAITAMARTYPRGFRP